jgi:UDP-N-acetylglucosamine/UDP-N-acetylgalactosamine diphosphorylase
MNGTMEGISPEDRNLFKTFENAGQGHVFRFWDGLKPKSRQFLIDQAKSIDLDLVGRLGKACRKDADAKPETKSLQPAPFIPIPRTPNQIREMRNARVEGEKAIREGKTAAFLVAGGQGTRLGFDGPKGIFPIGPVSRKSLFQMHAEKILAFSRAFSSSIPWYIMTSETNDDATQEFFRNNRFFGLDRGNVIFFKQRMIPALDQSGKLILEQKDRIFMSPNGHGGSLLALVESGAIDDMKNRGIEIVSYFQVDNLLIRIIDPVFVGHHILQKSDMSSKMAQKRNPEERVGIFGLSDGKLRVIEYSDLDPDLARKADPNGRLVFGAGSIAIHMISVSFVEELVRDGFKLPYHVAHKRVPFVDEKGQSVQPEQPNGYKFETFVFDALEQAKNPVILEIAREEEFSPVKNSTGEDSPETAERDMSRLFLGWLEQAGIKIPGHMAQDPNAKVEISPLFARDVEEFRKKAPKNLAMTPQVFLE